MRRRRHPDSSPAPRAPRDRAAAPPRASDTPPTDPLGEGIGGEGWTARTARLPGDEETVALERALDQPPRGTTAETQRAVDPAGATVHLDSAAAATARLGAPSDRPSPDAADPDSGTPPGGRVVAGRYRLGRRLGQGGFGTVWEAFDEHLEREVAVKVLARAEPARPRVQREAFAAARLNHPGIVALYELVEDDEARYLVSELVRGRSLDQLTAAGELSERDVARIGTALCDALEHAHEQGVVHRDVKPQNVMIPDRPAEGAAVAKLMDFGIAQLAGAEALTRTGDVVGTIAYMAPEQAEGRRVGPAADLYSLGLVLYEALAGEHPVRRGGAAATARRIGAIVPPLGRRRRDLPPELCAAVDRAVRPAPAERGTLAELRHELADALPDLSDQGRTIVGSPVEGLQAPPLPRGLLRLAAGLGAGGLAWFALAQLGPPPPAPPAAVAAGVAAGVALLPRLGWLAAALALTGWLALGADSRPGTALVIGAAAAACPLLLLREGRAWSAPAAAPLLGAIGLAGAFPALAGQLRTWWQRAALGAVGFWWLSLAEPLTGRTLFFGASHGTDPRAAWEVSASGAARHALYPLLSSGAVAGALLWAAFAAVLPWLVRGRWAAADIAAAAAWGAGLAAASSSLGQALAGAIGRPDPRGAVAGAVAGALLAVGLRALRGQAVPGRVP